jgi:hypothetical protein
MRPRWPNPKAALLHRLKWPPKEYEQLQKMAAEQGVAIAEKDLAPETQADVEYVLGLWFKLSAHRGTGFGDAPPLVLSETVFAFVIFKVYEFCTLNVFLEWIECLDDTARTYWRELNEERNEDLRREAERRRNQKRR